MVFQEAGTKCSADLSARRPWSYALVRALVLPTGAGTLVLTVIVGFGFTSWPQDDGLSRAIRFNSAPHTSTAGPYLGWYDGLPREIVIVLMAVAGVLALARVAASARPTHDPLRQVDKILPVLLSRMIVRVTVGTFIADLDLLLLMG